MRAAQRSSFRKEETIGERRRARRSQLWNLREETPKINKRASVEFVERNCFCYLTDPLVLLITAEQSSVDSNVTSVRNLKSAPVSNYIECKGRSRSIEQIITCCDEIKNNPNELSVMSHTLINYCLLAYRLETWKNLCVKQECFCWFEERGKEEEKETKIAWSRVDEFHSPLESRSTINWIPALCWLRCLSIFTTIGNFMDQRSGCVPVDTFAAATPIFLHISRAAPSTRTAAKKSEMGSGRRRFPLARDPAMCFN